MRRFWAKLANNKPQAPPSIEWLLCHRSKHAPAQTKGVTPTATLYRMYEYVVLENNTGLRTEIEWFFNRSTWAVAAIRDPRDPDPARYAILAVIPQFLVAAFNRLIKMGLPRGSPAIIKGIEEELELKSRPIVLEELPLWTAKVAKLSKTLVIPNEVGEEPDERSRSPEFFAMNVVVQQPYVMFI